MILSKFIDEHTQTTPGAPVMSLHYGADRRISERLALRWPVSVAIDDNAAWVNSTTENLSSSGFYCFIPHRVLPGQQIDCRLSIPGASSRQRGSWLQLLCRATVKHVDMQADGYGIGCAIQDYITIAGRELD